MNQSSDSSSSSWRFGLSDLLLFSTGGNDTATTTSSSPTTTVVVAGRLPVLRLAVTVAAVFGVPWYFVYKKKSTRTSYNKRQENSTTTPAFDETTTTTKNDKQQKQQHCQGQDQDHQGDGTLWEALSLLALFVFSHFVCYYLWWAAEFNQGCLGNPFPLDEVVLQKATPNATSIALYLSFIALQLVLAATLPGVTVLGFNIPQEGHRRLQYHCNGLASWYVSIALAVVAHITGLLDFKTIYTHAGAMLTTAILFADAVAVVMYLECLRTRRCQFSWKSLAHDFVMGQYLNPRLQFPMLFGKVVDLKLWAEVRVSWLLLFALDVSAALCLQEKIGYIPYRMWIVLLIHGLYTNACMKGEESIPYTWDIFQERWGWMLIYWNLAGVAFAYTFNGRFIAEQGADLPDLHPVVFWLLALCVLTAYWVFDEANAQKNRFRAQKLSGAYVERPWSLPQLPNATLVDPVYLKTKSGSTLLVDGWWKYVRKPHYTADLCLALLLCLSCGTNHVLPYFFVCFFAPMLIHREMRDTARCAEKYGPDWDKYTEMVPYILIPGIY